LSATSFTGIPRVAAWNGLAVTPEPPTSSWFALVKVTMVFGSGTVSTFRSSPSSR
jgi:hypothetical protein